MRVNEKIKEILKEGELIKEEFTKGIIETKLSKIEANLIGRKIKFKALIVGEDVGRACERYVRVFCKNCGEQLKSIDLLDEENIQALYEKLALNKVRSTTLRLISNWGKCKDGKEKHEPELSFSYGDCFDYSVLFVRELPENIETFSDEEYKSLTSKVWKVYYIGIPKGTKRAEVEAIVFKDPKTNKIEFLSKEIHPLEDEFESLKIGKEDHLEFIKYFRDNQNFDLVLENQIAPHIVGRSFEKLSMLLTLHSPYEIFDIFNSRKIRGCIRTIWIGDTKTGKSEIAKDITYMHYKIGDLVFGETASRTGLAYSIDPDNKSIIWGALPLNDKKCVIIDGFHYLSQEDMVQLREILEQQRVKVSRSVSDERLARVRIVATLNPNHPPMKNYYYKMKALMDTRAFFNPVDLTRWDLFIPFCTEDVSGELIATAKPKERPIPDEIFRKHVLWVWSLKPENIRYSENAKEKIVEFSKEMFEWVSSSYPLIHSGIRDVLTRISVAFACLRHSISEDLKYVEVKEEHVKMAKDFIEEMIQRIDYDAFIYKLRDQSDITEEEFEEIRRNLKEMDIQILRELTNGPKSSPQLASIVGISATKLKENHYSILRRFNLIETSQGFGAKITTKGILFLKKLEERHIPPLQSSHLVTCSNPENIENKVTTGYQVTTSGETTTLFLRLPNPISGICSYCSDKKVLTWITKDGHLMCDECKKHSDVTKQTQNDTQIQDTTLKILEIIKDKEAIFGQYIPEDDVKNEVEKLGYEWSKVKDYLIKNGYIITIKPGTISLVV